jgi:hypothetical protein
MCDPTHKEKIIQWLACIGELTKEGKKHVTLGFQILAGGMTLPILNNHINTLLKEEYIIL